MPNNILTFENTPVTFSPKAYLNASEVSGNFGKDLKDYLKDGKTKVCIEALAEISKETKKPLQKNKLIKVKKDTSNNEVETWLHPKLAVDFARWLSPEFAVWCDMQIQEILSNKNRKKFKIDPVLDSIIPDDDETHKMESFIYQSYKSFDSVRLMISLKNGKIKWANQLSNTEVILDVDKFAPFYIGIENLKNESACLFGMIQNSAEKHELIENT